MRFPPIGEGESPKTLSEEYRPSGESRGKDLDKYKKKEIIIIGNKEQNKTKPKKLQKQSRFLTVKMPFLLLRKSKIKIEYQSK